MHLLLINLEMKSGKKIDENATVSGDDIMLSPGAHHLKK